MPSQPLEIPFPSGGVQRRTSSRSTDKTSPPTTAWAVNVRAEGSLDRRLRGGSRVGTTKFVDSVLGANIADIVSIKTSSTSGATELLVVLADSTIYVVEDGVVSTPVAYLTNDSGDRLLSDAGNRLVASSRAAPSSGFLVAGQQHVFAINSTSIVKINPKTGETHDIVASAGTVPTGMTFGAIFGDRLFLSGFDNAIYASKKGDYTDWNFGAHFENLKRAVPFQLSLGNEVGAPPTAMIPFKDKVMLCATARSLWVVRNDPTVGELDRVSEYTGIVSSSAWCIADGAVVFLAEDGLYQCNADGSGLEPLSPQAVPEELRDIDTDTTTVTMGYDHERLSFHIFLRTDAGSDTHWIYERQSGFWPVRMPDDQSPLAVCRHGGDLLLAGNDGYVRKIAGSDDDGTDISSHLLLGPVRLGSLDLVGIVNTLHIILANGSGAVNWRLVLGDTADTATDNGKAAIEAFQAGTSYSSYVRSEGSLSAGRSTTKRPRARGMWACLWLQSTAQWAFEGVTMQISPAGKWRG